jgi:4-alpha-glucanotransferase
MSARASELPAAKSPAANPSFNWLQERAAGVLLHPTSLPSAFGVGAFDAAADRFLQFLQSAGFAYWQICPLGPTGFGDSPYQCFSSFAGNPNLIDPAPLVRSGLLPAASVEVLRRLPLAATDFGALYEHKRPLLFAAYQQWARAGRPDLGYGGFNAFVTEQSSWLESYALFSALKDRHGGAPWWQWPVALRSFASARKSVTAETSSAIEAYQFIQYLFFGQWRQLRAKAAALGIAIIGDAPIFTARDSADVWAAPGLFQLDQATGQPTAVAGVPPDYFAADGQLWGNPLYDWPAHARSGYAWWIDRLRANFALCDIVRIDHFRGFEAYWAVPADAPTARTGRWVQGPGLDFFHAVRAALPGARLIAEDLGLLTDATVALREATGLPGMAVLQFAFGGEANNPYLPHLHRANSVVYSGTHDNDTTLGWYATADERTRDHVRRYYRVDGREIGWDFIRSGFSSVANLAVFPLQDLMSLGSEARFNTPGKGQGNWTWRYTPDQLERLQRDAAPYLRALAELYGRLPAKCAANSGRTSSRASSST